MRKFFRPVSLAIHRRVPRNRILSKPLIAPMIFPLYNSMNFIVASSFRVSNSLSTGRLLYPSIASFAIYLYHRLIRTRKAGRKSSYASRAGPLQRGCQIVLYLATALIGPSRAVKPLISRTSHFPPLKEGGRAMALASIGRFLMGIRGLRQGISL